MGRARFSVRRLMDVLDLAVPVVTTTLTLCYYVVPDLARHEGLGGEAAACFILWHALPQRAPPSWPQGKTRGACGPPCLS